MSSSGTTSGVYPNTIVLGTFAGIVSILDLPPLIWHCRNRNIAAACLVGWILLNNIINVINVILWPNDEWKTWYDGRGLCDIEVKIQVARSTALPAAMFCILKSLANVMNTKKVNLAPSKAQRMRSLALDLSMCLGLPLIVMFFHYIVQEARYAIAGISGCEPTQVTSWLSILLLDAPFLILASVDVYFAGLIIVRLRAYRTTLNSMLATSKTTKSRFFRLFILSVILILILTPVQVYIVFLNWPRVYVPYSWSAAHNPEVWRLILMIRSNGKVSPDRWANVGCGALVFVFFGMGRDAVASYRAWLRAIGLAKVFPCLKESETRATSSTTSSFGSRTRMFAMSRLRSKDRDSGSSLPTTSITSPTKSAHSPTTPKKVAFLSGVSDITESGDLAIHYDDWRNA